MSDRFHEDLSIGTSARSGSTVESTVTTAAHRALIARLRSLRERAGLTQAQLAELIDEDQTTVSAIETGRRRVDIIELRNILVALGESGAPLVAMLDSFDVVMAALAQPDR